MKIIFVILKKEFSKSIFQNYNMISNCQNLFNKFVYFCLQIELLNYILSNNLFSEFLELQNYH